MAAGFRLRKQANNPLPGDPAMQQQVDLARGDLRDDAGIAGGQYQADRSAMGGALGGLQGLADGSGPSLAQTQLQNQSDKNIASTMAAMGSARSGNMNATQMGAATAGVGMQQDTNQTMAELRAREQIDALNASGSLASTMAGMSSGRQQQFSGMGNDMLMNQYGTGAARDIAQASLINERLDARQRNRQGWSKFGLEAGGTVVGSIAKAFSDERVKCNIEDKPNIGAAMAAMGKCPHCGRTGCSSEHETESMGFDAEDDDGDPSIGVVLSFFGSDDKRGAAKEMGRVKPYTFEYDHDAKAAGMPDGKITGVMAQDLVRAGERGRSAVYDHPEGPKALHPAKSIGLALAACADHEDRMRKLERRFGKGGE